MSRLCFASIGFFPFKTIAIRVDTLERLKAIIRNEAKENKFQINEAMLSIAGVSKEQMEEILVFLNYEIEEKLKIDNEDSAEIFFKKKKSNKLYKSRSNKKTKLRREKGNKKENDNNSPFEILKTLKF